MKTRLKNRINTFAFCMVLLICSQSTTAQQSRPVPAPYTTGIPVNFIRTWVAVAPEQDANLLMNRPLQDVKQATQYIDGLGRPLQTVIKQGSMATGSTANDLVSPVEYDEYGREQHKYLPFAANSTGNYPTNDGKFKMNPFQQQAVFMTAQFYSSQNETFYYGKNNFEASPLSRTTFTYAPGNSWAGSENNPDLLQRRNIQMKYFNNTVTDEVHIWTVTNNFLLQFGSYTTTPNSIYLAGQLLKSITIDEHKKQVIEFKDKEGRLILKKVQLTSSPDIGTGSGYDGWLSTYYIYDDLGNLSCVIQPEGVKALLANWSLTQQILNEQCFRYAYDQRNRMVVKKIPGAGEVYMVYDNLDRLVMTQDANMRTGTVKWMVTKYDELNRSIETGLWTNNQTFGTHCGSAYNSTNYPNTSSNYEQLSLTHYDDYIGLISGLSPTFIAAWNSNFSSTNNSQWPYPQMPIQSNAVKGLPTWTKSKVLGSSNTYLYSCTIYNDKGKPIQIQSTNITGGLDVSTTQYSWAGQPLAMVQKHEKASSPNQQTTVIITKIIYDNLGRVLKSENKLSNTLVNNGTMTPSFKTIVQNEYDQLGQLKKKKIGAKPNTSIELESVSYDYNIRGWMLGANRDYAKDGNSNNYFGFDLGYDKAINGIVGNLTYNNPQYNGNIEGMVWKSKGDGEKRKYDFIYDAANRLMLADFTQYTGGSFNRNAQVDFSVKMGDGNPLNNNAYDANGNIKFMSQKGLKINVSNFIDQLTYSYQIGSNKLNLVTDVSNDNSSKLGDFKYDAATKTTTDYLYDSNGNLITDNNKKISGVQYNHLNLPQIIPITGKGSIEYVYDGGGGKIKKIVHENNKPDKTTLFINGLVYVDDVLQFAGHEEGRTRFKPAVGNTAAIFAYDYFIKDHLGNVRMVLTDEQQQDIYPVATLEPSLVGVEDDFYTIDQSKIVANSAANYLRDASQNQQTYLNNNGIPNNNTSCSSTVCTTNKSQYVYQLNSNSNKTGLGITLKVMAGDKLDIFGKSYYHQNNPGSGYNNVVPIIDLLTGFLNSPGGVSATQVHGAIPPTQINTPAGTAGINSMMSSQNSQSSANPLKPRAFINCIVFNEQFKAVDFKISMVGANRELKNHYPDLQNITIPVNGFVYIYCSNETPVNVFFDNLQVVHTRGQILEEAHYYPFGLVMSGISSKAANLTSNKEQTFQEQRFDNDFGVNYIQFKYRSHDPQIGRFIQIDPISDDYRYNSTYAFSENRVTDGRELEGLEYVSMHHYAKGTVETKMFYKSTDKEINQRGGTTAGMYNSASYGPLGKGVVHYYYDRKGALLPKETKWDQKQEGGFSDYKFHGLYSGPGCITKDGGDKSSNYNFSFQPIDWADAIAKRHDMDYAAATAIGDAYAGFLEDVRTVQADKDMVQRIKNYSNSFKNVTGVETPFRTSYSVEMVGTMMGQKIVIGALANYKQWKIDNGYGNKDTYDKLRTQFVKENPGTTGIIDLLIK